jgi:hypothetical protein
MSFQLDPSAHAPWTNTMLACPLEPLTFISFHGRSARRERARQARL